MLDGLIKILNTWRWKGASRCILQVLYSPLSNIVKHLLHVCQNQHYITRPTQGVIMMASPKAGILMNSECWYLFN